MRLNKYIASATGLSRRAADEALAQNRVRVNGEVASVGPQVLGNDVVSLDGQIVTPQEASVTILLHKPTGYVSSREGQGSRTVYDLLPPELHHLKTVGRLDKESSGLLLLTSDGQLAYELTPPSFQKAKVYEVELD